MDEIHFAYPLDRTTSCGNRFASQSHIRYSPNQTLVTCEDCKRNMRRLVDLAWFTGPFWTIGIVGLINYEHKYWKVYIGLCRGVDQISDTTFIADNGVHVTPEIAMAFRLQLGVSDDFEYQAV